VTATPERGPQRARAEMQHPHNRAVKYQYGPHSIARDAPDRAPMAGREPAYRLTGGSHGEKSRRSTWRERLRDFPLELDRRASAARRDREPPPGGGVLAHARAVRAM